MYILKGFLQLPGLDTTTPNVAAPIGELSPVSKTFSRSTTSFANPATYPNAQLTTFTLKDSSGVPVVPTTPFINTILALGNWLYTQCIASAIPTQPNANALVQSINAEFPDFTGVTLGNILAGTGPGQLMPEYVLFSLADGANMYQVKVWLIDTSFQAQYEDYKIFIVAPVPNLASLRAPTATVIATVANVSPLAIQTKINTLKAGLPETNIVPLTVNCCDPNNPGSATAVTFFAVCYGPMGEDADNIKIAITQYLAANSTATNWPVVLPSLYSEYEFVVIPFWHNYANQGGTGQATIYSSSVPSGDVTSVTQARLPAGYASTTNLKAFLAANLTSVATAYNGLMLGVVGNPNNASGNYTLNKIFPDYAALGTDSPDSSRLQAGTWAFYNKLLAALQVAATYVSTQPIPNGYTTATFNSRLFLGFNHGLYNYYVLTARTYA